MGFLSWTCEQTEMEVKKSMNFFKRQFIRVYEHPSIKGYLKFLTEDYTQADAGTTPFPHFIAYCEKALPARTVPARAAGK